MKTATEMAVSKGHVDVDSVTTLMTVTNPDADEEMMDLNVCGFGDDAYFEWVSEYGDPIGDLFYEIPEALK